MGYKVNSLRIRKCYSSIKTIDFVYWLLYLSFVLRLQITADRKIPSIPKHEKASARELFQFKRFLKNKGYRQSLLQNS
jgi:hypothetical protein